MKGLKTSLEGTAKVQIDSVFAIARTLRINISLNDARNLSTTLRQ